MKKHLRLLLGGLLLALALVILPTIKTEAATTIKTLTQDGKWVKTDKYYVRWSDSGNLYYKVGASGTSYKIAYGVKCASVNGTKLAYITNNNYMVEVYYYSLTAKAKKRLYAIDNNLQDDFPYGIGDIAIYGSYVYVSFTQEDSEVNDVITTYKIHMSTKKRIYVSTLWGYRFYQNGNKLICLGTDHKLRIYDFTQLKFTKTICSNTKAFAIVGSKLHYVKFMPKDTNHITEYTKDYNFEVKICSLTGSVYERYPIEYYPSELMYLTSGEIAFTESAVYVRDYKIVDKYSYKIDTWTISSNSTFKTLCNRYYTVEQFPIYFEYEDMEAF